MLCLPVFHNGCWTYRIALSTLWKLSYFFSSGLPYFLEELFYFSGLYQNHTLNKETSRFFPGILLKEQSVSSYWTLSNDGHKIKPNLLFRTIWKLQNESGNLTASVENFQNVFDTSQYFSRFPRQF